MRQSSRTWEVAGALRHQAGAVACVALAVLTLAGCNGAEEASVHEKPQALSALFGHEHVRDTLPNSKLTTWRLAVSEGNCLLVEKIHNDTGASSFQFAVLPTGATLTESGGVATVTLPTGEVIQEGGYVTEWDGGSFDTSERDDLAPACAGEATKYPLAHQIGEGQLFVLSDEQVAELNAPSSTTSPDGQAIQEDALQD